MILVPTPISRGAYGGDDGPTRAPPAFISQTAGLASFQGSCRQSNASNSSMARVCCLSGCVRNNVLELCSLLNLRVSELALCTRTPARPDRGSVEGFFAQAGGPWHEGQVLLLLLLVLLLSSLRVLPLSARPPSSALQRWTVPEGCSAEVAGPKKSCYSCCYRCY